MLQLCGLQVACHGPEVTQYLEDVEDHLETYLEEISRSIGATHSEIEDFLRSEIFLSSAMQCPIRWQPHGSQVCDSLRDQVRSFRDREQQGVARHV